MRKTAMLALLLLAIAPGPAPAEPVDRAARLAGPSYEFSSQARRPPTRLRVYPGRRLLYRDCTFRLAREWRPSGTVIVPRQHCWWVRG